MSFKAKINNIEIVGRDNASRNDYTKTKVIDLTGNNQQLAETTSQEVNGEIVSLPDGEIRPENSDILIIVGQ